MFPGISKPAAVTLVTYDSFPVEGTPVNDALIHKYRPVQLRVDAQGRMQRERLGVTPKVAAQ